MINETTKARAHLVQRNKKGFTLTEIAIVLGIIGLILGAIWTAAAAVYNNQRISHANTAILQIAQGIRGLYANAATDAGLSAATAIQAGIVPADLINGNTMIDPFPGGTTVLTPTTDGQGFIISMSNVPAGACVSLMMAVAGATRDPGLYFATAPGNPSAGNIAAVGTALQTTATITAAANPTAANFGGCTSPTANTINFGFSLKA